MKHSPSNKHTIAWFKLSEFVSRGEKEKALGIYKLLALSIQDNAFVCKLEGDILFSFNDRSAIDKYYTAAIMYQKDQRLIEAAAIFENLLTLHPYSYDYLNKLINLYEQLNFTSKHLSTLKRLFIAQIKNDHIDQSFETQLIIEKLASDNIIFWHDFTYELINENIDEKLIIDYINKVINLHLLSNDKNNLNQFLSKIEIINDKYYQQAIKQIKNQDDQS